MANSFSFGGVDFGGDTYGNLIVKGTNLSIFPELEIPFIKIAGRDGVIRDEGTWGPRTIRVDCVISGTSKSDLISKLTLIQAALAARSDQQIIFDSAYPSDRYFLGTLSRAVVGELGPQAIEFTLEFFCAHPFAYATGDKSEEVLNFTSSGQTLNTSAIGGSWLAYGPPDDPAVWTLDMGGSGSSWVLENTTPDVGSALTRSGSYTSSIDFRITPFSDLVEKSSGGGAFSVAMDGVSGSPPYLAPGVNNIKLTGPSSATLTIAYRKAYF